MMAQAKNSMHQDRLGAIRLWWDCHGAESRAREDYLDFEAEDVLDEGAALAGRHGQAQASSDDDPGVLDARHADAGALWQLRVQGSHLRSCTQLCSM